ncbi:MAG: tetratricopeptide repeat protein, partial [bacterium]|nr:tetratricopeptide repeat protein [bacterium]
ALTYSGVMLTQTGLDDQFAEGARRINQAVEATPNHPEARLWRAWLAIGLGQTDQAAADLNHLDTLNPTPEIARLSADLRARLG